MSAEQDRVKVFVDVRGKGDPAILFLHGWLASHDVWRHQVSHFSARHRVVTVDLRGFGASDKPTDGYAFEDHVADLQKVMADQNLRRPVVVGWSMGGAVAIVLAATATDSLSKLVLVDTTPKLIASKDFPAGVPPEAGQALAEALQSDFSATARNFVSSFFPESGSEQHVSWLHEISQKATVLSALKSIGHAAERDLRELLAHINVPTLVLCGDQDAICPRAASDALVAAISNAESHVFAGKGHCPFITDSDAFNRRLEEFVRGQDCSVL